MTEFSGEEWTDQGSFADIMKTSEVEVLGSVARFDQIRDSNLDTMAVLVAALSDRDNPPVPEELPQPALTEEADRFGDVVAEILGGQGEHDEKMDLLAGVFHQASAERSYQYNALTQCPDQCTQYWEEDGAKDRLTLILDQTEDLQEAAEAIKHFYLTDLTTDTSGLAEHMEYIVSQNQAGPGGISQTTVEIKKTPKEHALDVAKIAAGVLMALAIDKAWRQKQ